MPSRIEGLLRAWLVGAAYRLRGLLPRGSVGFVDAVDGYEVVGWAIDPGHYPARTRVAIFLEGKQVGQILADQPRSDLLALGLNDGRYGFRFDLSPFVAHGRRSQVEVKLERSGVSLRRSPQVITLIRDGRHIANISTQGEDGRADDQPARATVQGAPNLDALRREGVLIYAVRSENGRASPSVAQTIAAFQRLGYATVVINNFQARANPPEAIADVADMLIQQQSRGRDFAAWRTGLEYLSPHLREARRCVFVNDSLIGPFQDLGVIMQRFDASGDDLWGLTESFDRTYHIQSSFFVCRPELLMLPEVFDFFARYAARRRDEAVLHGELGLSQIALAAGAKVGAMCEYHELCDAWIATADRTEILLREALRSNVNVRSHTEVLRFLKWTRSIREAIFSGVTLNPQHFFWDTLIEKFQYPYIKRELLTANPSKIVSLQRLWEVMRPFDVDMLRSMIRYEMLFQGAQCALPPQWSLSSTTPRSAEVTPLGTAVARVVS